VCALSQQQLTIKKLGVVARAATAAAVPDALAMVSLNFSLNFTKTRTTDRHLRRPYVHTTTTSVVKKPLQESNSKIEEGSITFQRYISNDLYKE
jgi:hypothetical protein